MGKRLTERYRAYRSKRMTVLEPLKATRKQKDTIFNQMYEIRGDRESIDFIEEELTLGDASIIIKSLLMGDRMAGLKQFTHLLNNK